MTIKTQNQFYVVRHGRAESNDLHIVSCKFETQKPYGLSRDGKNIVSEEAKKYKNFDIIYTSPFRRTKETAQIFADTSNCDIIEDDRLKEFDTGDLDMQSSETFSSAMSKHKEIDYVFQNGESLLAVSKRLIDFVTDVDSKQQNKKILIVTHGVPAEILVDIFNSTSIKKWSKCIDKGKVFPLKT